MKKKVINKIEEITGIPKNILCTQCKLELKTAIIQKTDGKENYLCANYIDDSMCRSDITQFIGKINIKIKK